MCLSTVDKKTKRTPGVGYKIVTKCPDSRYVSWDHVPTAGKVEYPLNRWIEDVNTKPITYDYPSLWDTYPAGFHVYLEKPTRIRFSYSLRLHPNLVIIQVKFKKVVASGDNLGKTVVAREIINKGEVEWK